MTTRDVFIGDHLVTSRENLADISEPQIPLNEQKDRLIQFSICLFSFNGRKAISSIETE